MVAIEDSDDDNDLSSGLNLPVRKQWNHKSKKNKILDSDSSCDEEEEKTALHINGSNILQPNDCKGNDTSKQNGIAIPSKKKLIADNDDEDFSDDKSLMNNSSTKIDDQNSNNGKIDDFESQYLDNEPVNGEGTTDINKTKGNLKGIRYFNESSDDEDVIGKNIPSDNKNERTTTNFNLLRVDRTEDNSTAAIDKVRSIINDDMESDAENNRRKSDDIIKNLLNDSDLDAGSVSDYEHTLSTMDKSVIDIGNSDVEDEPLDEKKSDDIIKNLLNDSDLFDAGSVSDNEHTLSTVDKSMNEIGNSDVEDELLEEKKHSKNGKRPSKDALKEAKSEQQRLLRVQKFRLPYHVPEVKSLKDFLVRVPVKKTNERITEKVPISDQLETAVGFDDEGNKDCVTGSDKTMEINEVSSNDQTHKADESKDVTDQAIQSDMGNLFKQKPMLSLGNEGTIEFEETMDLEDVIITKEVRKEECVIDSFMKKFEEHTRCHRRKTLKKNDSNANSLLLTHHIPEKESIPGGRRIAFSEQMKLNIRKERANMLKEYERERVLLNEEDFSEESEEEIDDDDDEEVDENVEGVHEIDGNENATEETGATVDNADKGSESSNDEELEKWNLDDQRKALEVEMEAEEKMKSSENHTDAIDFTIEGQKAPPHEQGDNDGLHWEDSSSTISSVLPAGQGDPTGRKSCVEGRMTPYSKLIKSGLLDSSSNLNYNNNSSSQCPLGITLPCEDTQDLYKVNLRSNEESSSMAPNSFKLTIEETQFTQVIDSQGFFNDPKKSKRQLFDEDNKDSVGGFSQVIGLCSGGFDDEGAGSFMKSKGDLYTMFNKPAEFSMSQVIGLCSGKFTDDDDAVTSTAIQPTCKPVVCDEESSSAPPAEHPFSSQVQTGVKTFSRISTTSENIFMSETKPSKQDKPLGLSDIIDNNFDDNAIDYCTAPFSGQVTKEDSKGGVKELSNQDGVSKAKFDVGNWLNMDSKMCGKKFGSNSDGSIDDDIDKKREKRDIHGEGDNEDEVFSAGYDNDSNSGNQDNDIDGDKESGGDSNGSADESEEDEEQVEKYEDEEVHEELLEYQNAISVDTKKKWSKNAFMEKEAELSGSDINSDDEELGSEYDEYEVDSDVEDLPDGDKLKSQIHKIHQKKLLDQDQREIRLLQELYIEDADRAYGKKRQRNFRWRNLAGNDESDDVTGHPGDKEEELNLDNNMSQKLERAEREKYISELHETEKVVLDENSQSMLDMIKYAGSTIAGKTVPSQKPRLPSKSDVAALSQKRSGSFLSQAKASLSHLSSAMKAGGQGAKAFVFQTTEEDVKSADKENKAVTCKLPSSEPARKKTKFNPLVENSDSQSIFDLL